MPKYSFRQFFASSWAIDNRVTIFLLTAVIMLAGLVSYQIVPKENFPEVAFPIILVSTPYPGTSSQDMENLVTRNLEKELKGLEGIKEITSTSVQDFSTIIVEFETNVDLNQAKLDVQEAVDNAGSNLPGDLPADPMVIEANVSEVPIMFLNVSGNYDQVSLKKYAEELQDKIEELQEIQRVDLVGAPEREIQINVDVYKMEAASISFGDIEQAIAGENVIISGGELNINNRKVSVRLDGEFRSVEEISKVVVRSSTGNALYLADIAEIKDGFKETESIARVNGEPGLTLNIIKKPGENLLDAAGRIDEIILELKQSRFPDGVSITKLADQSILTANTLNELINTIVFGFILVTIVLMFFMGVRDALFVGLAVPLSSFIAFSTLPILGYTMNMVVLFSFILAMGIVVDNAIVVIENTYRIFHEEGLPLIAAAKKAAGEVIGPVFAGTLTTICPFLPLLFWPGPVGEFMSFLPVVMIITLFSSLFVAYVINPVFAVSFMKRGEKENKTATNWKNVLFYAGGSILAAIISYLVGARTFGNILVILLFFVLLNTFVLRHVIHSFQNGFLPRIKNAYKSLLAWSLEGWHPYATIGAVLVFLFGSMAIIGSSRINFIQFPVPQPNFVYIYSELPIGTDIHVTDSVNKIIEAKAMEVVAGNPDIKSVITNIALGAGDPMDFDQTTAQPHKGKVTVEFVPVKERKSKATIEVLNDMRAQMVGIPGAKITVAQDIQTPPGSEPVEVNLKAEDFNELMEVSQDLYAYLKGANIPGVEQLKWDVVEKRPEIQIQINRQKAQELGISSGQIGMNIRTALFGKEISTYRANEEEYPIQLRVQESFRGDISSLLNMRVSFMDMATGSFKSIPMSSVADISYASNYGGINRTDLEKSVKIYSNILSTHNEVEVYEEMAYWVDAYKKAKDPNRGVSITAGGIALDQQEEMGFLGLAFGAAVILIFMILVTQFNSFTNVLIILSQVLLSVVGVFLGHALTGMDFSAVLSGVGIVVLSGIVVNNGIILLDFFHLMAKQGKSLKESVIEGGAIRFTPVLLTASSTVLGLVPLAISLNLNFGTLISRFDPQIFFGGDSSVFWEPLSWSIIYGLSFATIITLLVIPVIYYLTKQAESWLAQKLGWETDAEDGSELINEEEQPSKYESLFEEKEEPNELITK